jgi:hypothetical protein
MASWFSKRRFWLALSVIAASLLGVFIYFFARGPLRLRAFKAEMIARGEILDLQKLTGNHPPANENAAPQLDASMDALGSINVNSVSAFSPMKLVGPGRARISWKQTEQMGMDKKKYSWIEFESQLAHKRKQLDQLKSVLTLPHLDRHLEFEKGLGIRLPHLSNTRRTIYWFELAIASQLHQSNLEGALSDICDMLRFFWLESEEPVIISQLVYIAQFQIAFAIIWEAMQVEGWNDSQLAQIQTELLRFHFYEPMKQAVIVERSMNSIEYVKCRGSKSYMDRELGALGLGGGPGGNMISTDSTSVWRNISQFFNGMGEWMKGVGLRTATAARYWYWKFFTSYDDEILYLTCMNHTIQQIDKALDGKMLSQIVTETDHWLSQHEPNPSKMPLSALLIGMQKSYIEKAGFSETMLQMAITAVAIKRYQIQNNRMPENLSQLIPAFLKQMPKDPMDGQPLRYRPNSEGRMLLYSIGKNYVDDGGNPEFNNQQTSKTFINQKDWVWPEPDNGTE